LLLLLLLLPLKRLLLRRKASASDATVDPVQLSDSASLRGLLQEHAEALSELRKAHVEAGGSIDELIDIFLLRFLLQAKGDLGRARHRVTESTRWRARDGLAGCRRKVLAGATLMELNPAVPVLLTSLSTLVLHRTSYSGGPIDLLTHDSFDPEYIMRRLTPDEYRAANAAVNEFKTVLADKASLSRDSLVGYSFILDFRGLRLAMINMRFLTSYFHKYVSLDEHFPKYIGSVTCAFAPAIFGIGYRVVRQWLSNELQQQIQIEGPASSAAAISAVAPPSSLPTVFGGSLDSMPDDVIKLVGWTAALRDERASFDAGSRLGGYVPAGHANGAGTTEQRQRRGGHSQKKKRGSKAAASAA